jgi:2-polyprenyl-3-methyl-5-hydroxy-6-metoxy-1,4-benzoquinol methylase
MLAEVKKLIDTFRRTHNAEESMRYMLELDNFVYDRSGRESVRYGGGLHTKHRHIDYHEFFVNNISNGDSVLDIGCGIGVVTKAIALKHHKSKVLGVDIRKKNILTAKRLCKNMINVSFVNGDIWLLPIESVNVVVMSNVLEHLTDRVKFLRSVKSKTKFDKMLLRVPIFERDWRVPLKKELGVTYMLDSTHIVEPTQDSWKNEIEHAGLRINMSKVCWGELWAVLC